MREGTQTIHVPLLPGSSKVHSTHRHNLYPGALRETVPRAGWGCVSRIQAQMPDVQRRGIVKCSQRTNTSAAQKFEREDLSHFQVDNAVNTVPGLHV